MADGNVPTEGKPRRRRRPITMAAVAAVLMVAGAIALWARDRVQPIELGQVVRSGDAAGFNVLFVTLDTVRRDRIGCYGYRAARTPAIDSLLAHGVRFDDAVTSVPLTLPSHATMLTGLYPPSHGVREHGTHYLASRYVTLPETLKDHGYDTAAFIGCFVLDERFGLDQGFDVYDFRVTREGFSPGTFDRNERSACEVTDAAIEWLRDRRASGATAPFFVWVHYFDPHEPWKSPLQTLPEFAGRPYDAEIAFVDLQLKRLLDELDKFNLRDSTLVVLVADHGEGLGEHGERNHGMLIYGCTMRIPFILACPGLFDRAYRVDDRVVGLVDLRPTLEDLLGISPTTPGDGQSLLAPRPDPDRAIYIETQMPYSAARWSPLHGLRRHREKYILAPEPEYYDLRQDPSELRNVYGPNCSGLGSLEQRLAELMDRWASDGEAGDGTRSMSDEEIERLSSLGYVRAAESAPPGDLPDPKAMMPVFNQFALAMRLHLEGNDEAALALAREAVEQCDSFGDGNRILAGIYVRLGRPDEAAAVLRKSIERNPDFFTLVSLAQVQLMLRQYDQAEQTLRAAEAIDPTDGRVPMLRGDRLAREHRYRQAIALYEEAIRMDENRVGIPAREKIRRLKKRMQRKGQP